jgi:biotin operon repressor
MRIRRGDHSNRLTLLLLLLARSSTALWHAVRTVRTTGVHLSNVPARGGLLSYLL